MYALRIQQIQTIVQPLAIVASGNWDMSLLFVVLVLALNVNVVVLL